MAGFPYQYLIKEAKHHPAIIRMKMRMHFDNLIQWSSFFLTYIPIPAIHSIAITFQGIKMGISYFGIVTNQCEKLLKVLYFAICICCFRIINIDEGGNLAASKIRNLECPNYEICLIDYGCGKFNRKIHIMEQYP